MIICILWVFDDLFCPQNLTIECFLVDIRGNLANLLLLLFSNQWPLNLGFIFCHLFLVSLFIIPKLVHFLLFVVFWSLLTSGILEILAGLVNLGSWVRT